MAPSEGEQLNVVLLRTEEHWLHLIVSMLLLNVLSAMAQGSLSLRMCMYACIYVWCVSACLSACLSVCLSVCLSICLYVRPSICMFVYLSVMGVELKYVYIFHTHVANTDVGSFNILPLHLPQPQNL